MSDLISKADLFNALATAKDKADCFAVIQAAPTVDAVPVVHGHWIKEGDRFDKCSVCGSIELGRTNYCFRCGAKMDEED